MARYVLEQRIGIGGMAEVFRARGEEGGVVAVKRLRAEHAHVASLKQRLFDEVRIVAGLAHPCIVTTRDSYELDGQLYLVMEYVDGVSVEHLMVRASTGAFIPLPLSARIVSEVARGLGYAHSRAVLHRDVSASNILVSAAGEVKLADFGLADAAGRVPVTAPGEVIGKWTYLSPRRRRGEPATAGDDLFALGVVIERLLHAADPRDRSPVRDTLGAVRQTLADESGVRSSDEVVAALGGVATADAMAAFLRQPAPRPRRPAPHVDLNATTRPTGPRRK